MEHEICDRCNRPILEGEMTHIQTKPYSKVHWECHKKWVSEKVQEGIDNYDAKRIRRLQVA